MHYAHEEIHRPSITTLKTLRFFVSEIENSCLTLELSKFKKVRITALGTSPKHLVSCMKSLSLVQNENSTGLKFIIKSEIERKKFKKSVRIKKINKARLMYM